MQGLLQWVLAGPFRAGLVAAALALSRLFDVFGAAVLALVALRKGFVPALHVIVIATPVIILAGYLGGFGMGLPLAVMGLWLPVLLLSMVLRHTASPALMLQAGVALFGTLAAAWYLQASEPLATTLAFIEQQVLPLFERMEGAPGELSDEQLQALARMTPGLVAAGTLLMAGVTVLIGRWWQALAFNPGGFGAEFQRLRHGRSAALVMLVLLVAAVVSGHTVAIGFAMTALVALVFQGIAVAHGVIAATGQSGFWLWGMYGLIFLLPLPATVLLAIAGSVDNWMDFRRLAGQDAEKTE